MAFTFLVFLCNTYRHQPSIIILLLVYFLIWDRERENREGAQRKKKTPHCLESLLGSYIPGPWDHDPSQRQSLNGLSHRSAPLLLVYFTIIFQKNVSSLWSGILYVLLIEVFSERELADCKGSLNCILLLLLGSFMGFTSYARSLSFRCKR